MQIDWWTLGFQTANVAILIWLLQRFFWRPVAGIIEQRRAATRAALADAKANDDKATAALADVEKTRAGFAAERAALLKQAHDDAATATAATLAAAAKTVTSREAASTTAIETEHEAGDKAWEQRSGRLAVDIAGRLAGRLDGPAVQESFLGWLLAQLRALPEATRRATNGLALEAVSATPIDAAGQTRVSGLIAEALGATPVISYRTDPALIAGLELHGAHLSVTNSWQADLKAILADASVEEPA
jgi:F-type H+-transporting ATPase subunit b